MTTLFLLFLIFFIWVTVFPPLKTTKHVSPFAVHFLQRFTSTSDLPRFLLRPVRRRLQIFAWASAASLATFPDGSGACRRPCSLRAFSRGLAGGVCPCQLGTPGTRFQFTRIMGFIVRRRRTNNSASSASFLRTLFKSTFKKDLRKILLNEAQQL